MKLLAFVEDVVRIYVLIDPRNGDIKYVGQTENLLRRRLSYHMKEAKAHKENNKRCNWIRELINLGLKPEIYLVEVAKKSRAKIAEEHWIQWLKEIDVELVNSEWKEAIRHKIKKYAKAKA